MDSSHQQLNEYDPEWGSRYEKEKEQLSELLGDVALDIQHIGSTAIPGLSAKPIIDIAVLVKDQEQAESVIRPLEKLGYSFDRNAHQKTQFPERHFFRKGTPTQFHLSLGYADKGSFWKRQTLFRDYLRDHSDVRDEYRAIKEKGLTVDPTGMDEYINQKTEFIFGVLEKAGFVKTW